MRLSLELCSIGLKRSDKKLLILIKYEFAGRSFVLVESVLVQDGFSVRENMVYEKSI